MTEDDEIITIRVTGDESCSIEFPNAKMASRSRRTEHLDKMVEAIYAWRKNLMETPPHE